MQRRIKFGVTLPQFGATWHEAKEAALAAEDLGYDSVWVADHFLGVGSDDPLEAWTEMSAVAALTSRVEIGFLVLCHSYRPPALLAKMAATFDQISNGRLIIGCGSGWFAQEYEAYGYDFPPVRTRLDQLEEVLEILKKMWTEDTTTFHGFHYHVENARCLPKPVRKPHPPILIGGGGEKVLLRLVAQSADIWNNMGIYHGELPVKLVALKGHCEKIGRDIGEIEISQQTLATIGMTKTEARRNTEAVHNELGFLTGAPELCLTGMPDEIIERVHKNVNLGVTTFLMSFGRRARVDVLTRFAKEVIPTFR